MAEAAVSTATVSDPVKGKVTQKDGAAADGSEEKKLSKKERKALKLKQLQEEKEKKEKEAVQGSKDGAPQKSKAELKAERRAKQEAERAAKLAKKSGEPAPSGTGSSAGGTSQAGGTTANASQSKPTKQPAEAHSKKDMYRVSDDIKLDDPNVQKRMAKKLERQQVPKRPESQKKVSLFSHLTQFERQVSLTSELSFASGGIHPAIIKLGLQYAEGIISGANSRCIALLVAFKKVIVDYTTPPQKDLSRDLESRIKPYINFLNQCRPKSVSMGNAIKYLKMQINHIPQGMPDKEAKQRLLECIDLYIKEKIFLAQEAISTTFACKKIKDGDVILIYSCSSLIRKVLCDAHKSGIKFRVVMVDSRPKVEGREGIRRLVAAGIKCTYVLINAISYMMPEVSKVFLGAHALLANGYVMSRVGSSVIAMVAKAYNVPVLVCCETYKFSDRVQTDSFVTNELGDPEDLVSVRRPKSNLDNWRDINSLSLLNLVYDVTPPDFVSMVITELGMLPCTSVPVVLRVKNIEG
ncbi:translation initiation factor eIF2B subunit delta-like [Diadema antillarum]|uniref:translation initiation factor eIF2B subunit delta-like n=1 Tax=Diadema antillarum TaxID=105358 RepID=UPI003A88A470